MPRLPSTLRQWVIVVFAAGGVGLLPWTIWLSQALHSNHVTNHWQIAWSGFDTALAAMFLATAFAALKRSAAVGALAAATGTLLVTDAWFDIILESHSDELRNALILAFAVELPTAALCFWIAYRAEHFLRNVVQEVSELHLPSPGESAAEGDLVGIFEVPADRKSARETRDTDPPS